MSSENLNPAALSQSNDLRNRIIFTIVILMVYRLGTYVPLAGIDPQALKEVMACTRDGIRINTFMLDPEPALSRFIERITEMNGGRAFFTNRDNLGDYLLVDFVEHRRKIITSR